MQELQIAIGALLQLVCTGIFVAVGLATCGVVVWAIMNGGK